MKIISYKPDPAVSKHPRFVAAQRLCETLRKGGWSAYWVGGAVRDLLLKPQTPPGDIDIATDAPFDEICRILPHTRAIGKAFGVGLVCAGEFSYEVATFRKESEYTDRRHPSLVGPGTLEEDSLRRDFTVNALYLDPVLNTVSDFHDGLADLQQHILRCVGDAQTRLHEDPLRILRLYRFAANYGFSIAPETASAAQNLASELIHISKERVLLEVSKLHPEALVAFAHSLRIVQNVLLNTHSTNSSNSYETQLTLPSVNKTALKFPGTLLALMCAVNDGFNARNWPQTFKSWPLSAEEKAHLELFQRLGMNTFKVPDSSNENDWKNFLESIRWLQRQARTRIDVAALICQTFGVQNAPAATFLSALASKFDSRLKDADEHEPPSLSEFIESCIKKSAQPLRERVQHLIDQNSDGSALGWARLIIDTHEFLTELGCSAPAPWHLDPPVNEETIVELCETAKRWSKINGSTQKI